MRRSLARLSSLVRRTPRSCALLLVWGAFVSLALLALGLGGSARAGEGAVPAGPPPTPAAPLPTTPAPASPAPDLTKAAERAAQAQASGSPARPPVINRSATTAAAAATGASILYPARRDVLIFSHARHDRLGIACERCHATAATSRSAVDLLLPPEQVCRDCHPIDRTAPTAATCGTCHRGFQPGAVVPRVQSAPPALKFSHAAHAATACRQCHFPASTATPPPLSEPILPSMQSCLSCHRAEAAPPGCTLCHLATPAGRIDVSLVGPLGAPPSGTLGDAVDYALGTRLRPTSDLFGDAHRPGFATDHATAAARAGRSCGACHDDSYCADCHAGTVRPLDFHPADYLQVHALEARRAASECSTCHRYQSFCVGCHERTGVATRAASEWTSGEGAFHPASWASRPGSLGRNDHAREARRNLPTCTSCHREDDCLPCHSADAGGLRVSPHPRNWRGSLRCRALDRGNRRMCLRCHVTPSELGCDWAAP